MTTKIEKLGEEALLPLAKRPCSEIFNAGNVCLAIIITATNVAPYSIDPVRTESPD